MARYKHIDTSPRFLAVDLQRQLLPGTFEHALNHLLDREIDLTSFDTRYANDVTGAAAYPPAMLLKFVLFAYSRGIVSSRNIERACREHITFIALSGDSQPHFTTIAGFVSSLGDDIAAIFSQVLFICDKQELIGREMFAIDGVKLPSNASKAKSGTRADFDARHQIIVEAQAHGTGSEQELLIPVVTAMKEVLAHDTLITADAGYHSEVNLKELAAHNATVCRVRTGSPVCLGRRKARSGRCHSFRAREKARVTPTK